MSLYDPDNINEVLHGRVRLLILAALAKRDVIDFVDLRDQLNVQDGSLHHALRRLGEAKFVSTKKGHDDSGKSRTTIKMTPAGHAALRSYLRDIQELADSLPEEK